MDERTKRRKITASVEETTAAASSSATMAHKPSGPTARSSSTPSSEDEERKESLQEKAFRLYNAAYEKRRTEGFWTAEQLKGLHISETPHELLEICKELSFLNMIIPFEAPGENTVYMLREKLVALSVGKLTQDSKMVYNTILGTKHNGIWRKSIMNKTRIHDNTIGKCLKELLRVKLIKDFRATKNPTKRMFICYELNPTEESTGGSFYFNGELDGGLVLAATDVLTQWVEGESWGVSKSGPKTKRKGKESVLGVRDERAKAPKRYSKFKVPRDEAGRPLILLPLSYEGYPDSQAILDRIMNSGVVKDLQINLSDVEQLIQMLILDDRLEEVSPGKYRTTRRVWAQDREKQMKDTDDGSILTGVENDDDGTGPGNGLTQMPCGRCPVKSECRIGGNTSPENCVYMAQWLAF